MYKNSSDEPRQELPRVPWGFWLLFSPFLRPFSVSFITILVRLYYVVNNIGIKTIIHHTLKLYQLSENDSSMQNVVPFLILIPYTKFKNRYHSELVNRILSKTVLLLTDKAENSEHWAWNISKEAKRGLISKLFHSFHKEIFHNEKKSENRSVLCLVFAQVQLFLKSKLTTPYKWNLFVVIFDWRKNQDNKPISVSSSSPYPISRKMSLLHIFGFF